MAVEGGVGQSSLQRFVTGQRSLRLDIVDRLAEYLGMEFREKGREPGRDEWRG